MAIILPPPRSPILQDGERLRKLRQLSRIIDLRPGGLRQESLGPDSGARGSSTVPTMAHVDLTDMPSSSVSDHDARYYTETEIGSVTAHASGAALVGVEDAAGKYAAATVEGVLAELGPLLAQVAAIIGAPVVTMLADGTFTAETTLINALNAGAGISLGAVVSGVVTIGTDATVEKWTISKVAGSDATTTGQTLVDVVGLTFAAAANTLYEIRALLYASTSNDTTGCEYGVQHSNADVNTKCAVVFTGAVLPNTGAATSQNALNTADTTPFLTARNSAGMILIEGYVQTGANTGNITIQHLKVTSGTSTVKIGSQLKVRAV